MPIGLPKGVKLTPNASAEAVFIPESLLVIAESTPSGGFAIGPGLGATGLVEVGR